MSSSVLNRRSFYHFRVGDRQIHIDGIVGGGLGAQLLGLLGLGQTGFSGGLDLNNIIGSVLGGGVGGGVLLAVIGAVKKALGKK